MAELETIRVYVRYNELLAADLRALIEGLERAYNQTDCFIRGTRRVYAEDRLQVTSVQTGNSIEITFGGCLSTVAGLVSLTFAVIKGRAAYWQGEKNKWEAKSVKTKFQQEENQDLRRRIQNALQEEEPHILKAHRSLEKLGKQLNRSRRIISVEIEFGADDEPPTLLLAPKRQIRLKKD